MSMMLEIGLTGVKVESGAFSDEELDYNWNYYQNGAVIDDDAETDDDQMTYDFENQVYKVEEIGGRFHRYTLDEKGAMKVARGRKA